MRKQLYVLMLLIGLNSFGQSWIQQHKIKAPTPKQNDKLGISLVQNSGFIFAGASLDDEAEAGVPDEENSNTGAVYVYKGDSADVFQKILPSRPTKSAYFGNNIDASEEYLVVGSYYGKKDPNSDIKEGIAYLYNYNDTDEKWEEVKILQHDNPQKNDYFGRDVSVSGDYLMMTSHGDDETESGSGAAYIFYKDESGNDMWGQQAKLKPEDPQRNAYFGWAGDLHGDYAVIGAYYYDHDSKNNTGAAYVFKRTDNEWNQVQKIIPDDINEDDKFGFDIVISHDKMVISAPYATVNGIEKAGKVYVYEKNQDSEWELTATLVSNEPQYQEYFGMKLQVEEEQIVVSAKGYNNKSGKAFLFTKTATNQWDSIILTGDDTQIDSEFSVTVSINQNKIAIGADDNADNEGALYVFDYVQFKNNDQGVDNTYYATTDWADFDNDGDIDYVVSGALDIDNDGSPDESSIIVYINTNGIYEKVDTPNVYDLHLGFVKFIDIDNDGDKDLVTSGQNYIDITTYFFTIYENDNGVFTVKQQLDGLIYSAVDTGDFDNDGDLDIVASGASTAHSDNVITQVYINENGSFSASANTFPGIQNGAVKFGDFDKDQDLDIILMGQDKDYTYLLKTFFNINGTYQEQQSMGGMYLGALDLGDFDNDGDLDFAIMGDDTNDDYASFVYKNENGSFGIHQTLKGIDISSGTNPIAWGDYDNDGDLDLIVSGTDIDYEDVTILYKNTNGTFEMTESKIPNVGGNTSVAWVDIDNDNDLDVFNSGWYTDDSGEYINGTFFSTNLSIIENQAPAQPQNLEMEYDRANQELIFTWQAPTDDFTISSGLHYLITIGTTQGGSELGSYKVYGTSWKLKNIIEGDYFWSVQAIDTAFVLSQKANSSGNTLSTEDIIFEKVLTVYPNPTIDKKLTITFNEALKDKTKHLSIYTITGTKVYDKISEEVRNELELTSLNSGIYILQIKSEQNILNKKLIIK